MAYSYDAGSSLDPYLRSLENHSYGIVRSGSVFSQPLVLDGEKELGELTNVNAPIQLSRKRVSEEKAIIALKNHSEAERRRRQRINSHLSTLRALVPCPEKRDKAALLAEVVSQVKKLKKKAAEASTGVLIPMDADEIKVEPWRNGVNGFISFKATLCCDYRPDLLSDLKQSLDTRQLKLVKAEISTLETRVKNTFFFTSSIAENGDHTQASQHLSASIYEAMSIVLDKDLSSEYSPRTPLSMKRQRLSSSDTSSSSSGS